jgi:hypothetical protein
MRVGTFAANSYAELVNQRSIKAERKQSLTKLNPLGMGILYNWEWAWSFSANKNDNDLEQPSKGRYGLGGNDDRYSGTFAYIGLSVQLPTMERIRGGHLKSVDKEANRKFYRALGTALKNDQPSGIQNVSRNIADGTAIPEIFHISSLFDLGALEKYMIAQYKTFKNKNTYSDFGTLVQDLRGGANGDMIGVNTDAGGGGGPLLNTNRPVQEWIMAAYYYINESNPSIKASRKMGFNVLFKEGSSLAEKIRDVFIAADNAYNSSVTKRFVSQAGIDRTDRKNLGLIPNFLAALGLKENRGITTRTDGTIDEEANFKDTLRGKRGRDLLLSLSVDTKDTKMRIFYSDSGFVSSKRDDFISKVLDEQAIMSGKLDKIDMNIEEAFLSLTESARAAGAQLLLAEIQKKKNAILTAFKNDAYNDIAVLQAFVKTKKEVIESVNDGVDVPGFLKEEIKGQIAKAKQSITKSFTDVEKILDQCVKSAASKYKAKAKTDRKTDSKFMKDS